MQMQVPRGVITLVVDELEKRARLKYLLLLMWSHDVNQISRDRSFNLLVP